MQSLSLAGCCWDKFAFRRKWSSRGVRGETSGVITGSHLDPFPVCTSALGVVACQHSIWIPSTLLNTLTSPVLLLACRLTHRAWTSKSLKEILRDFFFSVPKFSGILFCCITINHHWLVKGHFKRNSTHCFVLGFFSSQRCPSSRTQLKFPCGGVVARQDLTPPFEVSLRANSALRLTTLSSARLREKASAPSLTHFPFSPLLPPRIESLFSRLTSERVCWRILIVLHC